MTSETSSSPSKEAVLSKAALNAAKHLGLSHAELAKLLRISEASLLQCLASEGFLDPSGHKGERALILVQIFLELDAIVGGDAGARVTWMNAHNQAIGDLPRNAIKTFSGLVHIVPVLPLAPESSWQVTTDFVKRLYLDLRREADSSDMVVMGDSSGGCLALLLAQQLRLKQLPVPDALVLISAVLDLSFSGEDQPALEKCDPLFRIRDLRNLIALWVGELRANDPRVSPLFGDVNNLPPTLAVSGSWEIFNSDARRLAVLNPAIQVSTYKKMIHVWPVGILKESYQAMDEIATFVQSTTNGH